MERTGQAQDGAESGSPEREEAKGEAKSNSTAESVTNEQLDGLIFAFAKEKKTSEECMNRLRYLQADFDNYRKRMDRQMDEVKKRTAESIYANLLEVLDELELALSNGRAAGSSPTLMEGVEMTLKKLKKMLACEGISEIACMGQAFDPKFHCATSTVATDDENEGKIMEELRKGYLINGRVLRPAMVKVSVKKSESNNKIDNKKG